MKKVRIITHSGGFHSDDVFAVAVLQIWIERKDAENFSDGETDEKINNATDIHIIRTRDLSVIKEGDFVADVGGEYKPKKLRFDHHQKGGAGERQNGIPYSSFGLVWKEYGEELCESLGVADEIDKKMVQPIDAVDNGVDIYKLVYPSLEPYRFVDIIDTYNFIVKENGENLYDNFLEMVSFAKKTLEREIKRTRAEVKEKKVIEEIYKRTVDKRIIILGESYDARAWQETLEKYPEPIYIVREAKERDMWEVKAIKKDSRSFESRKDLPKEWASKTNGELAKATGVKDAIFCHNKKFIIVAKSKEGALKLAKLALNN